MLAKNQNQESFQANISLSLSNTASYQQLKDFLAAQSDLKQCIQSGKTIFETHFAQENKSKVETMAWLELQAKLLNFEETLQATVRYAQDVLTNSVAGFETENAQVALFNWEHHSKRSDFLNLFRTSGINEELTDIIDEALTENSVQLLSFLNTSLDTDLLALIEEQSKDFSKLIKDFSLAQSAQEQEDILIRLLGDPKQTDDLLFDVFSSGLMAMSNFELSFAAIATYAILCA